MQLHPRTLPVQMAGNNFERMVLDFQSANDLTDIEMLQILAECQQRTLKYMLREERHGTADKKADEA